MGKRLITAFILSIILISLVGFASAGWFDWFGKITGRATDSGMSVTQFVLVNAETEQDIAVLNDGSEINFANLPTKKLNIRADVTGSVGSVRFGLDGKSNYRTENVAPYALAGDNSGNYNSWTPSLGSHTVTATPYSSSNAGGTAGVAKTITFIVSEQTGNDIQNCVDSDNGMDYNVKGSVCVGSSCQEDSCSGSTLTEYYCSNNQIASTTTTCVNGCSNGVCSGTVIDDNQSSKGEIMFFVYNANGEFIDDALVYLYRNRAYIGYRDYVRDYYFSGLNVGSYRAVATAPGYYNSSLDVDVVGGSLENYDFYLSIAGTEECENCEFNVDIESSDICMELINKVDSPMDFSYAGINYTFDWGASYDSQWTIDDQSYSYTAYQGSWHTNYSQANYNYHSIYYEILVFEEGVDLGVFLERELDNKICKIDSLDSGVDYLYVCNRDLLDLGENYKNREVIWFNDNVIVKLITYQGGPIQSDDMNRIYQEKLSDFIDSLKNNVFEESVFDISDIVYPLSSELSRSLSNCMSDVELMGENESCVSSWVCKVEPIICPEYGTQTRICMDETCGEESVEETVSCSPGVCSGCYYPRLAGSSDNLCIPYGFRFEHSTGYKDESTLSEGEFEEGNLDIISETEALLTLYGKTENFTYELKKGKAVRISIPEWEDEISELTVFVKDIIYSEDESVENSIVLDIQWGKSFNAYCDITGKIKEQKTKLDDGTWASCQNNYECSSNLCSGGECIEVREAIEKGKGIYNLLVRVLCRLGNIFNEVKYGQCIEDNL